MFVLKILSKRLKIKLYMALIWPVLYESETWITRKAEEIRFTVFEWKIINRIYGPYIDSKTGECRIRYKKELKNLFQWPDITEITKRRVMWAIHTWRK